MKLYSLACLVVLASLLGCAPESSGPVSAAYHNMTAHYNSYFIAKERIKEIETNLNTQYQWNYSKILPIYPQYDTTFSNSQKDALEDCIKKASLSIQRHPGSKWADDAYILVGKARMYGSEFPEAIETYKYVNTKGESKNARHEGLVQLLRTFVESADFNNAVAVSDYLKKESLSSANTRNLYLNRAYMHQKRKELNEMVKNLVLAEELMNKGKERARIDFIIGQVYQSLGFDAEAYNYYQKALKKNPPYELAFYTKLNMAQVTQLANTSDLKKVSKYFKRLLNDPKNLEYKDRIYYEMGDFDFKQSKLAEAIADYKLSVASSTKNQRQKAYSYLKLSHIYFDSLKNFKLAKRYYDSTVSTLPRDEENYEAIKARQEILTEFVTYVTTIQENDSLLALSVMDADSLDQLLTEVVLEKERLAKAEKERKKKQERRERAAATAGTFAQNQEAATISTATTGTWYFYNPTAVSKGQSEFLRTWGDRSLADNWRIQSISAVSDDNKEEQNAESNTKKEPTEEEEVGFDVEGEKSALMATIPNTEEQKQGLLTEVEEAHYGLGNLYNFRLHERENAISTFETMIDRFPESGYKPEVLYQLYLLTKELDSAKSAKAAGILLAEFPDEIYAKLIVNPNFREDNLALTKKLQVVYDSAYQYYVNFQHEISNRIIDSITYIHPESDLSDNFALLKAMNLGRIEGVYKYQYELNNFINEYASSELADYAKILVKASEDYQINLFSSSKGKYIKNFNVPHYFILTYETNQELSEKLPIDVKAMLDRRNFQLKSGNLVLDESYAMVLVESLPGKGTANSFAKAFAQDVDLTEKYKGEKFYSFVITKENFEILYQTKDLQSYLTFYEKNYP